MAYYRPRLVGGALAEAPIPRTGLAIFLAIMLVIIWIALALVFALSGDVVEDIRKATVWISVDGGESQGTGVIISPEGHILTAAHLIKARAQAIEVVLNSGQPNYQRLLAEVLEEGGDSPTPDPAMMGMDYALIKVTPRAPLPHLKVVESGCVREGTKCFVAGFPLGSAMQTGPYGPNVRIDPGHVTAVMRDAKEGAVAFNTDVAIREGISGGPCTDEKGRVIGLALMYSKEAEANLVLPSSRFSGVWGSLNRG